MDLLKAIKFVLIFDQFLTNFDQFLTKFWPNFDQFLTNFWPFLTNFWPIFDRFWPIFTNIRPILTNFSTSTCYNPNNFQLPILNNFNVPIKKLTKKLSAYHNSDVNTRTIVAQMHGLDSIASLFIISVGVDDVWSNLKKLTPLKLRRNASHRRNFGWCQNLVFSLTTVY